ncbi:MAG: PilT protein domain protein [Caulobacteraceae bacterium]|nr:PilT protein domain protein [Caulobacteraceae bacterium]
MILSLDSNVLIDLMRGAKPHVRLHLEEAAASGAQLKVSAIVVQELVLGAHLSARPDHQLELLGRTLGWFEVEPWSSDDAIVTGRLRSEMERQFGRIGAYDTLIAGQALARGWSLVTADVKDFARVQGLHILDWSNPAGSVEFGRP